MYQQKEKINCKVWIILFKYILIGKIGSKQKWKKIFNDNFGMVGPEIPVVNCPLSRKFKTVRKLEQDSNKDGRIEMKPGPRLSLNQ